MYLGLDVGTSGMRALLIDALGVPIGSAEADYPLAQPHPGWSEQDPADWITALEQCVAALRAQHPEFAATKGIGVAGHMHGATLIDAAGHVIRPCILWNDTRSAVEAARLDADPRFRAISGNIVFPGFTAPKLVWVKKHEPENFARIDKVLLPAAYLNLYLTGDYVADMSDSAGTSWFDTAARDWSDELLAATDLGRQHMPRLVEGSAPAGSLRPELAARWGLDAGVVIAGGAGDNAAAACGIGAMGAGQGFVSLGTSGVVLTAADGFGSNPDRAVHSFAHAVPDRWYQMSVILAATASLNWFGALVGAKPAELTRALGDGLRRPSSVEFLPYLSGERTPHNDPHIRGGFVGASVDSDRQAMTHALLSGVGFGLRDGFEALRSAGAAPTQLWAIGGGAASDYWLRLLATIFDLPLVLPAGGEFGAAIGAARLGWTASGGDVGAIMTQPSPTRIIEPRRELVDAYEVAYQKWRRLYPLIAGRA